MEFVTIHDLSRELNVPARVIRYRLIQPIAERKLKQHEGFRRDEFKDNQYFDWKNPASPKRIGTISGVFSEVSMIDEEIV